MPPYIGIAALLLLFAGMWCFTIFLTSAISGWRVLARKYAAPANRALEGETFRAASGTISRGWMPANYKGCLIVNCGRNGIYMVPWITFRFSHPPLLIPWRAVKNIESEKYWLRDSAKIEIRDFEGIIRLYGKPGAEAVRAFTKFRQ